jgi:hypothetical protein
LLAALAGCGRSAPSEPAGAWWAGRSAAVRELLAQIAQLEGTPLARRARELGAALPECESVGVHAPDGDGDALLENARCLGEGDPLERIRRASGSELVFALPASLSQRTRVSRGEPKASDDPPAGGRRSSGVRGAIHSEDGALAIELRWPDLPG